MSRTASQAGLKIAPSAKASRAMEIHYPGWAKANSMSQVSRKTTTSRNASTVCEDYNEFYLSSNWILRPEGLKDFFADLGSHSLRGEVTFDVQSGCFRARCPHGKEAEFVSVVKSILDKIAQQELAKISIEKRFGQFGGEGSIKIRHINEWRVADPDAEETEAYERYSYPRELAEKRFQTTWKIPANKVEDGFTLRDFFGKYDPVNAMNYSAGCTVAQGIDGASLKLGAESKDQIDVATRKLNNLIKYHVHPAFEQHGNSHILYEEDEEKYLVEMRFMAHLDRSLLRTTFLDRHQFKARKERPDYGRVFEKGTVVRMLPFKDRDFRYHFLPMETTPAIPNSNMSDLFKPFGTWSYKPKQRASCQTTHSVTDQTVSINPEKFANVNPQAFPKAVAPRAPSVEMKTDDLFLRTDGKAMSTSCGSGHVSLSTYERKILHLNSPSSASLSPQTTTASSQVPRSRGNLAASVRDGASRPGKSSPLARTPSKMSATSRRSTDAGTMTTGMTALNNEMQGLRKTLDQLNARNKPAQKSNGILCPNPLNDQLPDPFIGDVVSQTTRTPSKDRLASPTSSSRPDLTNEYVDLLGASPEKPTPMSMLSWSPLRPTPRVADGEKESRSFHSTMRQQAASRPEQKKFGNFGPSTAPSSMDGADKATECKKETRRSANNKTQSCDSSHTDPSTSSFADLPYVPPHLRHTKASAKNQISSSRNGVNGVEHASKPKDPSPETMEKISKKLVDTLEPLRMLPGNVSLKADVGRFILVKINPSHISIPNNAQPIKAKSREELEDRLDSQHFDRHHLLFTNIVSISGGDANYIADLPDKTSSSKMWAPKSSKVIYEFRCSSANALGKSYFTINIDGTDEKFTSSVERKKREYSKVFLHCMKRRFDVQLSIDATEDLEENYGDFTRELIENLEIRPQETGVPHLDFINFLDWHAQINMVRIRNVAQYIDQAGACTMEISEVHDMDLTPIDEGPSAVHMRAATAKAIPQQGYFPVWYETCIKSVKFDEALSENIGLEFADEASWTAEGIKSAGAFEDLVKAATDVVKQMDGVAYWCDNRQDNMTHPDPPVSISEAKQRLKEAQKTTEAFW